LDAILQAVIDFIPPAFQYPEITCAKTAAEILLKKLTNDSRGGDNLPTSIPD
jgi:hypothetical protein